MVGWMILVWELFSKYTVTSTIAVVLVLLKVIHSLRKSRTGGPLPPGPRGWPFVGYLPFVLAEKPTKLMSDLKETFGNVFGFRVGVHYCVMLSDYKSVREGFNKKQALDRPPKYMRMSTEYKTLAELKGADWEEQRLFLNQCFKTLGIGRNEFEDSVMDELSRVIPKMERCAGKPNCNIRDMISGSLNNLVFKVVCGRWFEDDHQFMKDFLHFQLLLVESFSNNMAVIYFPWVDWFLTRFQAHMKETMKSASVIEQFIRSEVAAHEKVQNETSGHDYMDLFLREKKLRTINNNVSTFTREQLIYNSLLLLLAGTDTVRNTLEWLIMAMAKFPDVQTRVHEELDSVMGGERIITYIDKSVVPYTEAVIMESERWKTLVPLNVLRLTTEDTTIQGFFIPEGTVLINNLHNCHMDPDYWESPEEFRPERFLSKDRTRVVVPEFFMPFSVGKRDCPGDKMANIEIFLYFATLMQKFKFSATENGVDFDASHRMNLQAHNPIIKVDFR